MLSATLAALAILNIGPSGADAAIPDECRRAPRLARAAIDKLPKATLLCTPNVQTLLGYTRRALHLRDGHTLALFSYSGSAEANWLFLIDSADLTTRRVPVPNNDIASHGAALGSDGDIYVMPYGTGRSYRFDVKQGKFEQVKVDLPEEERTWEALGASNGCIYFGTYPNAYFGEYDTRTGKTSLWPHVASDTTYVTDFSEDAAGRIKFRAWGPAQVWMLFDPITRALTKTDAPTPTVEPKLPDLPKGDESFAKQVTLGDRRFVIGFPSSRLWEVGSDGKLTLRGNPEAPAESWFLERVGDAIVGVSHYGAAFSLNAATGRFIRRHLPNAAPGGNHVMFVEAIGPDCVIGANYSQQSLWKVDPRTGSIEYSSGMIAKVSGQPMCALEFGHKAYLGLYIYSILSKYDPELPFEFGKNPREIADLHGRYHQTRPRDAATDGKLVFISNDSAYNELGGALAVIDPKTDHVEAYHQLIKDQNLPTLAYDPATRLLWGGTDRWGQMRSHPPTQESSLIYAFDPATRKVAATLTPWPGSDETAVLGMGPGVLVAACGSEIALIDTRTREVLYKGESPIGVPSRLRLGSDGLSYCLAGGTLYRWDLPKNLLTPLVSTPECSMLTESAPRRWVLANATSVYTATVADAE